MTLNIVRNQWKRIVFMQTNREDVGKRFYEIMIPIPPSKEEAHEVSSAFRNYYHTISTARIEFGEYLKNAGDHHFFVAANKKRLLMKTMWPNKSLNSDAQKRRFAMLLHAG